MDHVGISRKVADLPEDTDTTTNLVNALAKLSRADHKLVSSKVHEVETKRGTKRVRSWKMNEYKYAVQPSPFPTLARGLFTEWLPDKPPKNEKFVSDKPEVDKEGRHRVIARGYDKFFNIGEVRWTSVSFPINQSVHS